MLCQQHDGLNETTMSSKNKHLLAALALALGLLSSCSHAPIPETQSSPAGSAPWTHFMEKEEHERFLNLVEAYFLKENRVIQISDDTVYFPEEPDSPAFSLLNLAQSCHLEEQNEWPKLVLSHLRALDRALVRDTPRSFEDTREHILLRLIPDDTGAESPDIIQKVEIPGTKTLLVFDSSEAVIPLSKKMALQAWNKTEEELFALGEKNLLALASPVLSDITVGKGLNLKAVRGDSYFIASLALILEAHPEWSGRHGLLFGIPTRDTILMYPIEDEGVLEAMNVLPTILAELEKNGPGSVSKRVYFYRDKSIDSLAFQDNEGRLVMTQAKRFLKVLKELSDDKARN